MYRIIMMNGTEMAVVDRVTWIKISRSGSYAIAKNRGEAIGISYKSVPYNLLGFDRIEGAQTVMVSEIDAGEYIKEIARNAANIDYISMMTDVELPEEDTGNPDEEEVVEE